MKLGYDIQYHPAGKISELKCGVCLDVMKVRRGCPAEGGRYSSFFPERCVEHDEFTCANSSVRWHEQAVALMELIKETPSRDIAKIVQRELEEVIRDRRVTK